MNKSHCLEIESLVEVFHFFLACPVQGEWTTTARKGKKKEGKVEAEGIVAPGDSKTSGGKSSRPSRGTSKAGEGEKMAIDFRIS